VNLKPEDAARLIGQTHTSGTVLIGGQAVAFWAAYYRIESRLPALTADIDFLGTQAEAKRAARNLKIPHRLNIATFDDATPHSAVLLIDMEGYSEPIIIDYLAGVIGVDARAIRKSAVTVQFENEPLRVLHPLQLLQTKIWNLYQLVEKRTEEGVEQARLSIAIAAAYIDDARMGARELLKAVEAIARFAATEPARYARDHFTLDCLQAIPKSAFAEGALPPLFHEKRWPQLKAAITRK
jgi:hypothetical protein